MAIPTDFSGLVAWHEAFNDPNADGSTITRLCGVGGMPWGPVGGGASAGASTARPTVVTLGSGRRAYRFDNVDDCISTAANLSAVPFTVVIMYAAKSTATTKRALSNYWDQTVGNVNNWLIGQRNDTSAGTFTFHNGGWINGPALDVDVMHVHAVRQRASGVIAEYRVDGVSIGTNSNTNCPNLLTFGGMNFWGEKANADIIGMCAYNVALSDANLAAIEAYWLVGGGGTMTTAPVIPVGSGHLVCDIDPDAMTGTLANNDPLDLVTDSSGYGNDASQADSGLRGVFKTAVLNGFPVMEFNGFTPDFSGRGKYLQTPDILIPSDGSTFIAVCRRIAAVEEHSIYSRLASLSNPWAAENTLTHESHGGSPSLDWGSTAVIDDPGPALNEWFLYSIVFDSPTSATHYYNGPPIATFNPPADADLTVGLSIGSGEAAIQVARAQLYDVPLTCFQRWLIMLELATRYDLRATLSNTSGCPGQSGGVTGFTHVLARGTMRTSIDMAGQPKGGYKRWRPWGSKSTLTPPINIPPEPIPLPPFIPGGGGLSDEFALVELVTLHVGTAFTDTAMSIPDGVDVESVSVRVTQEITGTGVTDFDVGTAGTPTKFNLAPVALSVDTTDAGTNAGEFIQSGAEHVRLTINGGFPDTGQVRVTITYSNAVVIDGGAP